MCVSKYDICDEPVNIILIKQVNNYYVLKGVGEGDGASYIFQVQGGSTISFSLPAECHQDCINKPIDVKLDAGQIGKFLFFDLGSMCM